MAARDRNDLDFRILGRRLQGRGVPVALCAWLREHWHRPEHVMQPTPFRLSLECQAAGRAPPPLDGPRRPWRPFS